MVLIFKSQFFILPGEQQYYKTSISNDRSSMSIMSGNTILNCFYIMILISLFYKCLNKKSYCSRFSLYLKLFCLTGLTWVFEIISWLIEGPDSIWYVTDIINVLRGVFIFIIFCCKKKVYIHLKAKFCKHKTSNNNSTSNRTRRSSSMSPSSREMSSQRTNSFQLSQVIDSVE